MRDPMNVDGLVALSPDYIGFIFYPPSKRYVRDIAGGEALDFIPEKIRRTGVFVNASMEEIEKSVAEYKLKAVQLHGNESIEMCEKLLGKGIEVIKAFHVDSDFNFQTTEDYLNCSDLFLFDTKTEMYGGSGKKFSWDVLKKYTYSKPFMLSGGIGIDDVDEIGKISHKALYALDINSKFELSPGVKDLKLIKEFLQKLKG